MMSLTQIEKKVGVVAIAGRPNSGKSTLLNAILGVRLAAVSPKAQMTRNQLRGIYTTDKVQILFIDTPGIHRAREASINAYMLHEAEQALRSPDLIWYLVDPYSQLEHEKAVLELLERRRHAPVALILNKMDLNIPEGKNELFLDELKVEMGKRNIQIASVHQISALEGLGIESLLQWSSERLPLTQPFYDDPDQLSDRPTKFFVSEFVREQLFAQLGDELPYSSAVSIESFEENTKPKRIEASIVVERESQKGMVIGKGGTKIKAIGQAARMEIEKFLGEPIFLGLKVKVVKDWTKDPIAMQRLGYRL